MYRVGDNLDSFALNSRELDGKSCRRIAIVIIINYDAKEVDRGREHENQPQHRPTQISLNRRHRVQMAENGPRPKEYIVT